MDEGMIMFFKVIFAIALVMLIGVIAKNIFVNDPQPNQDYIKEVMDWSGRKPCCNSIWLEMCEDYKKEINKTFDCFE